MKKPPKPQENKEGEKPEVQVDCCAGCGDVTEVADIKDAEELPDKKPVHPIWPCTREKRGSKKKL